MKRIHLAGVATVSMLTLAACGSSGSSGGNGATSSPTGASSSASAPASSSAPSSPAPSALPTSPGSVTIGSAKFPESVILADLWGDAMAAKGVKVTKKLNIGERPTYLAALNDGSIGAVPEYTGSILYNLDPKATAKTPTAVYQALQPVAAGKGYAVAKYAAAQDSDTITVTKNTASKNHLKSIGDLKSVASKLTLGAPPQFKTRPDGVPALKSVYGVTFGRFTTTDAGGSVTVNALKNGSVDAADIFSTDPSIVKNGFVSLADDKSMFAAQNVVPLFSKKVLTQPMKEACDAVSAKLDTKTLAQLVYKVQAQGADAEATAKAWLQQNGLL
jgi:osmoprotectant transport system substrate-binding protein